jgi:hypothetical protein
MNSRSSASMCSGAHVSAGAPPATGSSPVISSCHQWSRPAVMAGRPPTVSSPVRLTTTTWSTHGVSDTATSTLPLRPTPWPRRHPPSAVITTRASASRIRSRRASEENPPNTTEWTAPMRVQASMATASSGTIGM